MLYSFTQGITTRSFGLLFPPDWYDHVESGNLELLVALHGGGTDPLRFMEVTEVGRLMTGALYPDVDPATFVKPKIVALFPAGLGERESIGGGWRAGHVGGLPDPVAPDDVAFVFSCIERVDRWMTLELERLRGVRLDSVFTPAKRFIMGFSNGAALTGHVIARRPGFFAAAAMHSHLFSGWKHQFLQTLLPAERNEPTAPVERFQIPLIHVIGTADVKVLPEPNRSVDEPGVALDVMVGVNREVGSPGARGVPDAYWRYDLSITDSLQAWAAAAGIIGSPGAYTPWLGGTLEYRSWTDPSGRPWVVQGLIDGLDHSWWQRNDIEHATRVFWDFFHGAFPP